MKNVRLADPSYEVDCSASLPWQLTKHQVKDLRVVRSGGQSLVPGVVRGRRVPE